MEGAYVQPDSHECKLKFNLYIRKQAKNQFQNKTHKTMETFYKILSNHFVGIIIMSIALMYFVYSFDYKSVEFYLAIGQAIFMEYFLKWFFKKYGTKKV